MYKGKVIQTNAIEINDAKIGAQSLEEKIRDIMLQKGQIDSTAPMLYTERKDGVLAGYDIRTDRFNVALDAADKINGALAAKRAGKSNTPTEPTPNAEPTPKTA